LDSEHRAEHFDTSLDILSQAVFEIFKFSKIFLKLKNGAIYVDHGLT
jgi:hypothetical protein